MEPAAKIEQQLLSLPFEERERVVVAVWESLVNDPAALSNPRLDPDGIALAKQRDSEIESGTSTVISHNEFRRATGGDK